MHTPPWFTLPTSEKQVPTTAIVIGAGLAGSSTARRLAQQGWKVTVLERGGEAAAGASGNRCALLRPHASRDSSVTQQFFTDAFNQALNLLKSLGNESSHSSLYRQTGALQLTRNSNSYHESAQVRPLAQNDASKLCGVDLPSGGLFFPSACTVDIAAVCKTLLEHPGISTNYSFEVTKLSLLDQEWLVSNNKQTLSAPLVVLANGASLSNFPSTQELSITPARGQTTEIEVGNRLSPAIPLCGHHYLIPQRNSHLQPSKSSPTKCRQQHWQIGASFDRNNDKATILETDDDENILGIYQLLGDQLAERPSPDNINTINHWVGVRATTPDRLPVTGALPDCQFFSQEYADLHHGRAVSNYAPAQYLPGFFVNGGFGSRGLCVAAICAELLVAQITANTKLDKKCASYLQLLHPARFHIRRLKRG